MCAHTHTNTNNLTNLDTHAHTHTHTHLERGLFFYLRNAMLSEKRRSTEELKALDSRNRIEKDSVSDNIDCKT